MAVEATLNAADASGIHNVFRYIFDVPTGAITNPPLLSISFDASGNPVIHTPPLNPAATGFDISILASDTLGRQGRDLLGKGDRRPETRDLRRH